MKTPNPYKGLFPYEAADEPIFFGRDKEATDLVEMIMKSQLVVLFGESGTGKTSLIKAKLFPTLFRQYYFPIYIRINYAEKLSPIEQVRKLIHEGLLQWDKNIPEFKPGMTLLEYASITKVFSGLVKPVLFFDQFEEIFTLAPRYVQPKDLDALLDDIGSLADSNYLPPQESKTSQVDVADRLQKTENILRFTVVLSLRQDFIPQLDDLRFRIPSIQSARYRIKKFDFTSAYAAITGPLKKEEIEQDAVMAIIGEVGQNTFATASDIRRLEDQVRSHNPSKQAIPEGLFKKEIDPTLLSLYCNQLYDEAPKKGQEARIKATLVGEFPQDAVLERYYKNSLPQRRLRHAIEQYLITPDGRRVLIYLTEFSEKAETSVADIEKLKDSTAIVRIYGIDKDRQIELAHDRIAAKALQTRRQREANRIKLNAWALVLTIITIVISLVTATLLTIEEAKKNVNIEYLKFKNDTLNAEVNSLTKETDSVNSAYRTLLSTHNLTVTNNATINNFLHQLQATVRDQQDSLKAAHTDLSVLRNDNVILIKQQQSLEAKHFDDSLSILRVQHELVVENGKVLNLDQQARLSGDTVRDLRSQLNSKNRDLIDCNTARTKLADSLRRMQQFIQQMQQQTQQQQQQQKQPQQQQQQKQ